MQQALILSYLKLRKLQKLHGNRHGIEIYFFSFQSVTVGFTCSFAVCFWWGIGAFFVPRKGHILPVGTCASVDTLTLFNNSTHSTETVYTTWSQTSNATTAVYTEGHSKG